MGCSRLRRIKSQAWKYLNGWGKNKNRKTKTMTKSKHGKATELTKTKNVFSKPTSCWLVLLTSHKVESSEKCGKVSIRPECRQVLGAFSCYGKAIVGSTIPLAGSSRLYKKTDWASHWEQTLKQHSCMVSASVSASRFLPWVSPWFLFMVNYYLEV